MPERTFDSSSPKNQESRQPSKLRFLVAVEFHSKDSAADHMVDLMETGWPKGPRKQDLKLIVINQEKEGGQISGIELATGQLGKLNYLIDSMTRSS